MQTILTTDATWCFVAKNPQPGLPPRIAITSPFRIGRREGFDLCLNCRNVSGLHAELLQGYNNELWIEDLNSTNGTFVNGKRIRKRTAIKDGDTVQFGKTVFTIACIRNSEGSTDSATLVSGEADSDHEAAEERFERLLKDGVVPFFQPIYNISGDSEQRRVGFEVLGRSHLFGLQTPDQMFTIATDLEKESVLSRTLRLRGIEAAESTLPDDMMLFVNTHPKELDCGEIQVSLSDIRSKFPDRPIMLELSEHVLYSSECCSEVVKAMKDLDVQLALHGFGAAQIRLAELSEVRPQVVKFDGALTQRIDQAEKTRKRLVATMVQIALDLGITPMAEFVETESEHETLKQLGFELVQGYYYGHPVSIDTLDQKVPEIDSAQTAQTMADVNRRSDRPPLETIRNLSEPETSEERFINENIMAEDEIDQPAEVKDAQWLLDQENDCFTIQLMFTGSREDAETFVAEQKPDGEYAIYRKWSSGREWHVVAFGIFAHYDDAKSASEQFENTGHSSWVRQLTKVKEEIHSIESAN